MNRTFQRWIKSPFIGDSAKSLKFLPLPGGEGRGEGERRFPLNSNGLLPLQRRLLCAFGFVSASSAKSAVKTALSFALLLLTIVASSAADTSSAFDAANKLYEQGKFSDAAAAYEQLIESGKVSSALYFNLGNAYFKSGQLGHAVAAYRDAEKLTPRDPEVRANLQFVRGQVQGPSLVATGAQHWLAALTINEWAIFAAVVLWLWLCLFILIQFRPGLARPLRTLLWLGGVATLALCGCLAAASSISSAKTAIVVAHDVVLHNGPLDEAPGGTTVHDGAELSVLDTKNDWLQVRVDNTRIGWLKRDQVVVAPGA